MMRAPLVAVGLVGMLSLVAGVAGQQPAPPGIAPATARLDQTLGGLDGPGFALVHREDGDLVFAACERGTIQYWAKDVWMGVRTGEKTPHVLKGHEGPVIALARAAGTTLASAGADGKVLIWDVAELKAKQTISPGGTIRSLAFSNDGKYLAVGGIGQVGNVDGLAGPVHVELWDWGKPERRFAAGAQGHK